MDWDGKIWIGILAASFVFIPALSGCVTPGGPGDLDVAIHLDRQTVKEIDGVLGRVEISNSGSTPVVASLMACSAFYVQRIADQQVFPFQCSVFHDMEMPPKGRTFQPGESVVVEFSFSDSKHHMNVEAYEGEFPRGRYGLSADTLYDGEPSKQTFFHINPDIV